MDIGAEHCGQCRTESDEFMLFWLSLSVEARTSRAGHASIRGMKNALPTALASLFLAGAICAQDAEKPKVQKKKIYSNSYVGKVPPELGGQKADWLNRKSPISLRKLKGRVVWLEFSFIH